MAAGPVWGTYVAIVCEVEVERSSGKVRARRVAVAHDCGLVINPLGLRRAIEGGIVQGISRTLCEEVQFDPSRVTSVDWFSYPILDVMDAPDEIEVTLIENKSVPPSGGGEAAGIFIPAAIGNALFDATGVRYRKLPLTAERVRAGLA
jgi:CO/xanthine dehydrogenase Mo-binding subunit